jgi:hypothetical protein
MGESYRDLRVWQRAMELVFGVYDVTRSFPKDELYGLVSQCDGLPYLFRATSLRAKAG